MLHADFLAGVNLFREDGLMLRPSEGIEILIHYLIVSGAITVGESDEYLRHWYNGISWGEASYILKRLRAP